MSTVHRLIPRRDPTFAEAPKKARPMPKRRPAEVHIDRARLARLGMIAPDGDRSLLAEEMRTIRRPLVAQMRMADALPRDRIVLVTSARPNEGKTFVSVNLALSLAQEEDTRVVLIDADATMRGSIRALGLDERTTGLSTLLQSDPPPLSDVLLRTDVKRLSFIGPGPRQDDLPELFSGTRMARLLEALVRADERLIVVLDAPPVLATSEAMALAPHAGQTVFVVEAGRTARAAVEQAVHMIAEHSDVQLLLNKAKVGRAHAIFTYCDYDSYNGPDVTTHHRRPTFWRRLFGGGTYGAGLALWVSLAAAPVALASWAVVPHIEFASAFTDNVEAEPEGAKDSDLVVKVAPGVRLEGNGRRFDLVADYTLEALGFAAHRGESALRHRLDAAARAELVQDLLFVDLLGDVGDVFVDEGGPTAVTEFAVSDNRTTRLAGSVSPYVAMRLADWADVEARYRLTETNYGTDRLADVRAHTLGATLASLEGSGPLGWKASVVRDDADFDASDDLPARQSTSLLAAVDTSYALTERFALLAGLGYSELDDETLDDGGNAGLYWRAGFEARPTRTTRLRATGGQMFDEPDIQAEAEWRLTPKASVQASYVERISSRFDQFRRQIEERDPFARDEEDEAAERLAVAFDTLVPDQGIVDGNDALFYQRRAELSASGVVGRNVARIGGYVEERDFDVGPDQDAVGLELLWLRRLGRRTDLQFGATWRRIDQGGTGEDDEVGVGLAWVHELSPLTTLSLGYQYDRLFEGDEPDTQVNTVFVRLRREF
ncbi:MAG: TIGR03016 family PEP-CTERM system-associated outer membrane protein [Geminicoccaceae bacterium]|nr:TIGR03016 family PEP-CTERM system-associated outer membrane protein [Geminicoccaceae bacterium]